MRLSMPVSYLCLFALCTGNLHAAPAKPNSDWPCQQILVGHMSPAAVWSGPSIAGVVWSDDADIGDLATKLAARRLPLDEAKTDIDAFAKAAGPDKSTKLTKLFAALFEKLDADRSQVVSGLERFGHVQKSLADRIRAENESLHSEQNAPAQQVVRPDAAAPEVPADRAAAQSAASGPKPPADATPLEHLQWNYRLFEERRHILNYVCDVPTLIEQRLFALAHDIQDHME